MLSKTYTTSQAEDFDSINDLAISHVICQSFILSRLQLLFLQHVKCFLRQTILKFDQDCKTGSKSSDKTSNSKEPDKEKKEDTAIDDNFLYGMTNAAFVVAGALGAFSTGVVADKIGR